MLNTFKSILKWFVPSPPLVIACIACVDGKEWKCSKFLRVIRRCILQTGNKSLKQCIVLGK